MQFGADSPCRAPTTIFVSAVQQEAIRTQEILEDFSFVKRWALPVGDECSASSWPAGLASLQAGCGSGCVNVFWFGPYLRG